MCPGCPVCLVSPDDHDAHCRDDHCEGWFVSEKEKLLCVMIFSRFFSHLMIVPCIPFLEACSLIERALRSSMEHVFWLEVESKQALISKQMQIWLPNGRKAMWSRLLLQILIAFTCWKSQTPCWCPFCTKSLTFHVKSLHKIFLVLKKCMLSVCCTISAL